MTGEERRILEAKNGAARRRFSGDIVWQDAVADANEKHDKLHREETQSNFWECDKASCVQRRDVIQHWQP